jgi:hypothetical protein
LNYCEEVTDEDIKKYLNKVIKLTLPNGRVLYK